MTHPASSARAVRGTSHNLLVWPLAAIAVLGLLTLLLIRLDRSRRTTVLSENQQELFVFCAAGIRYPMEQVAREYEDRYGVKIDLQYGGSNTLLNQLEISRTGDLYLAADDSYLDLAREKGLSDEVLPLALMKPVIAVRKENPRRIQSIDDLLRDNVKVALGNPEAAAVGKKARSLLTATGQWDRLEQHVTDRGVFKPTVNDVANDIKLQSVDAGIIWDATVVQYPELAAIEVPQLDAGEASIGITVLRSAANPAAALHFARFLGARDVGLKVFKKFGFNVVDGDIWQDSPSLTLFAGSVNRRALESIVETFEQREGVRVNTVYNGCGILTAQMETMRRDQQSGFPDAYMACDVYYLETVKDLFQDDVRVSDTSIVIVVQAGNPKGIRSLADLTKPGIRVALGQPEQCTIGVLSRRLLEDAGIYQQLLEHNVVTQTATSALLIPNITTTAADAVLAYETDTLAERDKLEIIRIDSPLAKAIQPFSIARSSDFKHLGRRLFAQITRSRSAFEGAGFHWLLGSSAEPSSNSRRASAP